MGLSRVSDTLHGAVVFLATNSLDNLLSNDFLCSTFYMFIGKVRRMPIQFYPRRGRNNSVRKKRIERIRLVLVSINRVALDKA